MELLKCKLCGLSYMGHKNPDEDLICENCENPKDLPLIDEEKDITSEMDEEFTRCHL